jgi:hypothetical protein
MMGANLVEADEPAPRACASDYGREKSGVLHACSGRRVELSQGHKAQRSQVVREDHHWSCWLVERFRVEVCKGKEDCKKVATSD